MRLSGDIQYIFGQNMRLFGFNRGRFFIQKRPLVFIYSIFSTHREITAPNRL